MQLSLTDLIAVNKKVELPSGTQPLNIQPIDSELTEQIRLYDSSALYWLSGYCKGLADAKPAEFSPSSQAFDQRTKVPVVSTQILYASQTGNAEQIARDLFQALSDNGVEANLASVADFNPKDLSNQQILLLVAATHGEGEPPDDAIEFYEFIQSKRAPQLADLKHAVFALGDSSYEFFCQTGKDFDQTLSKLGSKALLQRVDCDLDFAQDSSRWIEQVIEKVSATSATPAGRVESNLVPLNPVVSQFNRNEPFAATVLLSQSICGRGSDKNVQHIELSLSGSGLSYQPGDSLGVWAKNNPTTVEEILSVANLNGEAKVVIDDTERNLREALSENLEVSLINKNFVNDYAKLTGSKPLEKIAREEFSSFIKNHQLVDLLILAPFELQPQQLVDLLKPIKPRLYSIASSYDANPEEVHLTVALEQSENDKGHRFGTASHFLIESVQEDDQVLVFVDKNTRFKLPANDQPVIMIGAGTGIAPFRAFLQQRQFEKASGENWLFFGNPHFNTDFLYQLDWQDYLKDGLLSRLNLAFSRDHAEKIYVQHRLIEQGEAIWRWLEQKQATIYVCGDRNNMAREVEQALLKIIQEQSGASDEQAGQYLSNLAKDRRYQRDVY